MPIDPNPGPIPNIIKVIAMYRSERDITFEEATVQAVQAYDKNGWVVPDSIRNMAVRFQNK